MRRSLFSQVLRAFQHPPRREIPVLMYHHIRTSDARDKLSVSPENFTRQMKYLHDHDYQVISLKNLIEQYQNGIYWKPRTVAITFDDGFLNFSESAIDALNLYEFSATMFLITSRVGQAQYLGWDQIKALANRNIDFGSHTVTHENLTDLDDEALRYEVSESKRAIEENLQREVSLFSYPRGQFDQRVKDMVVSAGYDAACVTNPSVDTPLYDRYLIRRIKISPTSNRLWAFRGEISGLYQWYKEIRKA